MPLRSGPLYWRYEDTKAHMCIAADKPMPYIKGFAGGARYDTILKRDLCPQAYSWEFDDLASTYVSKGANVG